MRCRRSSTGSSPVTASLPRDNQQPPNQHDHKLTHIIKTFRDNHIKLIQKIEESDKKRDVEHNLSKRKLSEKIIVYKHDFQPSAKKLIFSRPFSQRKSDRNIEKAIKEFSQRKLRLRSIEEGDPEDCEEDTVSPSEEQNMKMVKVKMNKLVPLSMDRLRERLKLL